MSWHSKTMFIYIYTRQEIQACRNKAIFLQTLPLVENSDEHFSQLTKVIDKQEDSCKSFE